ncbi:MAG: carboxypeptidase-like regulatory domain-containing protein [Fimbriiglobus sp.]
MFRWGILAVTFFVILNSGLAHDVIFKTTIVAERVRLEAFFEDDSPAAQAKVIVRQADVIVAEGETDAEGIWVLPVLPAGNYVITLDARDGHVKTVPLLLAGEVPVNTSRAEMTSTPWLKLSLGVGGLLLVSAVSWWRMRRNS